MCMALAGGNQPDEPKTWWRRLWQWLSFGVLLTRFLAVGLWQWLTQRLIPGRPGSTNRRPGSVR